MRASFIGANKRIEIENLSAILIYINTAIGVVTIYSHSSRDGDFTCPYRHITYAITVTQNLLEATRPLTI